MPSDVMIESDLMGDHEAVPTLTSRTNKKNESSKGRTAAFVKSGCMLETPLYRVLLNGTMILCTKVKMHLVGTISRKPLNG